jgi:very-short-patch-repair endonuclease
LEDSLLYRVLEKVPTNISRKFRWKNPDLICVHNKFGIIVIEVDGAVHDRKVQKTLDRNELYISSGIKLIVLNIADIKFTNKTIFEVIDSEMTRVTCAKH